MDKLCQIHGTPEKPANHTHRECWVFKQAGKLNVKHKGRETPSEDEDEPRQPNTGGQKKFPPEVKTVNMIYATHIPKRRHKLVLRDAYNVELVVGVKTGGSRVGGPDLCVKADGNRKQGTQMFTQVRALSMEVKPTSCLINIDDMGSRRVDLPRDRRG